MGKIEMQRILEDFDICRIACGMEREERERLEVENKVLKRRCDTLFSCLDFEMGTLLVRAEAEVAANAYRGDWDKWQPPLNELITKIKHHFDEIIKSSRADNADEIRNNWVDIFNYVRKGWEMLDGVDHCGICGAPLVGQPTIEG